MCKRVASTLLVSLAFTGAATQGVLAGTSLQRYASIHIATTMQNQNSVDNIFECPPELQFYYDRAGLPKGRGIDAMTAINALLQERWSYLKDADDEWSNQAFKIVAGGAGSGDCEDLVITAITMGACAGVPADKMGFAFSNSGGDNAIIEGINHAVGLFIDEGMPYVMADTTDERMRPLDDSDNIVFWQTADQLRMRPGVFLAQIDVQKYRDEGVLTSAR